MELDVAPIEEEALVRIEPEGPNAKRLDHAVDRTSAVAKLGDDLVEVGIGAAVPEVRRRHAQLLVEFAGRPRCEPRRRSRRGDRLARRIDDAGDQAQITRAGRLIAQPRVDRDLGGAVAYHHRTRIDARPAVIEQVDLGAVRLDKADAAIDAAIDEEVA